MRRLYSTFATGWPGVGLLLMRLVIGVALVARGWTTPWSELPLGWAAMTVALLIAGVFLGVGLWTPIMGALVTGIELAETVVSAGSPMVSLLQGAMGAALAMLGPGQWSIDARLFGWRRVEVQKQTPPR